MNCAVHFEILQENFFQYMNVKADTLTKVYFKLLNIGFNIVFKLKLPHSF